MMPIAILVGGLGKRVQSLTKGLQKCLLPINGTPFILHQIELLRLHGYTDFVLCVNQQDESVQEQLSVSVRYSFDNHLGTGGAVRAALPLLGDDFMVLYGDSYLECDYIDIEKAYRSSRQLGLMTVFENEDNLIPSNVIWEEGRILKYNKLLHTPAMKHVDYGLSIFSKHAFDDLRSKVFDLSLIHQRLIQKKSLAAYEVSSRFYEVGSLRGFTELCHHLSSNI